MVPVQDEKPRTGALFASQRHFSLRLGVRVGDLDPTREADPGRERRTGRADAALGRPAGGPRPAECIRRIHVFRP